MDLRAIINHDAGANIVPPSPSPRTQAKSLPPSKPKPQQQQQQQPPPTTPRGAPPPPSSAHQQQQPSPPRTAAAAHSPAISSPVQARAAAPPTPTVHEKQQQFTASKPAKRINKIRTQPEWAKKWGVNKGDRPRVLLKPNGGSGSSGGGGGANGTKLHSLEQAVDELADVHHHHRSSRSVSPGRPGSSGPKTWEANILDVYPIDQINKMVADWLFVNVINSNDLGADSRFEVEAKLGHIIDQSTNMRFRGPSLTDFIIDKNAAPRLAFRSTMTEQQHQAFNKFLNEALVASMPPKDPSLQKNPPRIPLSYKHTKQIDTFYELTQDALASLPPMMLGHLSASSSSGRGGNPHQKSRVRITTDQKTGEEIAKIIKVRVADMDISSNSTPFDVRISINIEHDYRGPLDGLQRVTEGPRQEMAPPRVKDRLTYKHLAYQVDLTQVATGVPSSSSNSGGGGGGGGANSPQTIQKEHELEIEITAIDELKRQGLLLREGRASDYERMVRGFVDNIRVLQRQLHL